MGDQLNFVQTLSQNASLPQVITWLNAFARAAQDASARNLILGVNASGAALSTLNNAASGQVPIFTGPSTVGLAAPWTNFNRNAISANYTVQNSDRGATLALGGSAFFTLTFGAASGYDSTFVVMVVNEDTGRGKRITLAGGPSFILWPLQTCIVFNDNNVWMVLPSQQRWVLPGNTSFFVDPISGNDNNDGLASGAGAFASFAPINPLIGSQIDTNRQILSIILAAGTYSQFALNVPVFGGGTVSLNGLSSGSVTINNGGSASVGAVTCNCQAGGGGAFGNSSFVVQHVTMTATGGGNCFDLHSGNAALFTDLVFGSAAGAGIHIQVDSNNSRLFRLANYSITGGASAHLASVGLGLLDFNVPGFTVSISGNPTFTTAFAFATIMSNLIDFGTTFSVTGTVTGTRFVVNDNSVIYTNGGGANYFPGTVAGTAPGANGGQYV
jgi:hypothetical protein